MPPATTIEDESKSAESTLLVLLGGAISGAVADIITHPLSTIKTRIQVQGAQKGMANAAEHVVYRGSLSGMKAIIKSEGIMLCY